MKKIAFILGFLILAVSLFAQAADNSRLFIEGTADREDHQEFFLTNFNVEARSSGFIVTATKQEAAHTLGFTVTPNMVMVQGVQRRAPPGESQFVLNITLLNNRRNEIISSLDFYFSDLMEVYEYTQLLFIRATAPIPSTRGGIASGGAVDRDWQNKWVYFRTSFDYPITFNALQPKGLIGGQAVYEGTYELPGEISILENIVFPQPGVTLGLEVQFLNFMSAEGNFQISMGNTDTYSFINWITGAALKFALKSQYLMYQPYGAIAYQLNTSSVFTEYPSLSVGGGMQIGARAGKEGSIFVDVNYMYPLGDMVKLNKYDKLFPNPDVIYYNRYVIGLAIGYKYGSFDR